MMALIIDKRWKRYPIRAVKQVAYFYIFFILLYLVLHLVSGKSLATLPDFSTLFTPRLLIGLSLLGVCYPLIGFVSVRELLTEGGMEKHEQPLREIMSRSDYKLVKIENAKLIFRAYSPMRRVLTMFEDDITMELMDDGTLLISGLRKEVSRIRLRVGDYVRNAKSEQQAEGGE
ncbi:MAG: hypothetical protein LBJ57_04225 [Prevotellaceae bacterium]|jgi:hypothetical protein|nr:hypothetical protein [Prevotellaceae bacterium]